MTFVFIVHFISVLLILQPDSSLSCDTANWWASLDKKGWSVCPNDRTFLKGLWRSAPGGNNGLWLIEQGSCCAATERSYANQPSTCSNANWWKTLDGKNVWALCPAGYYMEGIYITDPTNIYNIEESKCCRPQNHPNSYEDCYDEDVTHSFDNKGWSTCKRDGYYMTGIYKSVCEHVYCIEKFKCCKMKKAGGPPPPCDTANWWGSLDKKGWSVCPNDRKYLKGLFRSAPGGNNGLWLIEEGRCCAATEPSYANQPSTCSNANWWKTLDGKNVWALCPAGYYMEGIYITDPTNIYNIEESKCCRPHNHPNSYEDCYDEDVTHSFDIKGWSTCKRDDYYMTGIYKSVCEHVYCIEKFKCCKMKKAGGPPPPPPCDTANWWGSLDKKGWSVCPNDRKYLKGLFRSAPGGNNGLWLIEEGRCCPATDPSYTNQPATCTNANWWGALDPKNVWALCPTGYYMEGIYITDPTNIYNIEESKCCRPRNHPNSYEDCYDEDVTHSFDNKGWSTCKRDGYYMTGIYKSVCEHVYCIEKFKCCRMKKAGVNGGWTDFGNWGQCSADCGGGQQERSRTCANPPPSGGGAQCSGPAKETRACNTDPCAVNGGWSNFGNWGQCSARCGDGQQERSRTCTNPPPSGDGAKCSGPDKETRTCNNRPCPVDGGWSDFGEWGTCTKECGGGIQERTRTCTNPSPAHDGKDCEGDNKETRECNSEPCEVEKVDGGFTQWSEYSACSKTCGNGRKIRTRECTNPPPSGGGKNCKGKYSETSKCKVRSCKGIKNKN